MLAGMPIPMLLHQFWANREGSDAPPADVAGAIARTRDAFAGHEHQLWDRAGARGLIAEVSEERAELFDRVNVPAMQSDLFRLTVLSRLGGIYLDAAVIPLGPREAEAFERIAVRSSLIAIRAPENPEQIANRLIACEPGHELIARAMDRAFDAVAASVAAEEERIEIWDLTGSALSRTIASATGLPAGVTLLEPEQTLAWFTRVSCAYKQAPETNWPDLQSGQYHPVYGPGPD